MTARGRGAGAAQIGAGGTAVFTAALLRRVFQDALRGALERVRELTSDATARRARAGESWRVIAIGKSSLTMFQGASLGLARSGAATVEGLVVAPDGTVLPPSSKHVTYMHTAHPLPDARSVRAAERSLAIARSAGEKRGGNLLVLVSGGASSLVSKPAGMSLMQKRQVVDALLRAGATIEEINLVRRHLSAIKGGGLLRAAGHARVVTLVVSDVLADTPWDIGSGPSAPDPTTRAEARAVLSERLPGLAASPRLVETLKPRASLRTDLEVIASPRWFAREVARGLRLAGLRTRVLRPSQREVSLLADKYVQIAHEMGARTAVVRAAEPGLVVPRAAGRGGRCSHLAALVAPRLPVGVVLLAGATDGVDGSSGTAGAVVSAGSFANRRRELPDATRAFDTGPLHVRAGTALPRLVSGVNFADVHVLVRVTSS